MRDPSTSCKQYLPSGIIQIVLLFCLTLDAIFLAIVQSKSALTDNLLAGLPIATFVFLIAVLAAARNSEAIQRLVAIMPFVQSIFLMLRLDVRAAAAPPQLYFGDGGHFENLGLIPLIQRQCAEIIIASGSEAQSDSGKEELLQALKQARLHCNCEFTDVNGRDVSVAIEEFFRSTPIQTTASPAIHNVSMKPALATTPHPLVLKFKVHYHNRAPRADSRDDPQNVTSADVYFLRARSDLIDGDKFLYAGCCCSCCAFMCSERYYAACCPNGASVAKCCVCCAYPLGCSVCRFPNIGTALQFLSPAQFDAYAVAGMMAWNEAIGAHGAFRSLGINPPQLQDWDFANPANPAVPLSPNPLRDPFTPGHIFFQPHSRCRPKHYCCPCNFPCGQCEP